MLDNGAFELELASGRGLDAETVLTAAELVGASEIVCTDVPYDGAATVESTRQFLEHALKYPAEGADRRYIGVPQGSTRDEWLDCYQAIAGMREIAVIGVSKLSVPMCWSTTSPAEVADARLTCVAELHDRDLPPKPLHLLGGDRSLAYELARHRALGHKQVRSNDSSAAAWYAAHDLRIDAATGRADAQLMGKPDLEHARLTSSQRRIACANVSVLREHAGLPRVSFPRASLRNEESN